MSGIKHLIALTVAVTLFAVYVLPPAILFLALAGSLILKGSLPADERIYMIMLAWTPLVVITVILYKKRRLDKFLSTLLGPVDK